MCTWHFALFSSNLVNAWKFFAGIFGAFFKHIKALIRKGENISKNNHRIKYIKNSKATYHEQNHPHFVLHGFPTTITLALRDATVLRAFP